MDPKIQGTLERMATTWLQEAYRLCNSLLNDENRQRSSFDEHSMLTAVVMARRHFRQLLKGVKRDIDPHVQAFMEATRDAKSVRDAREHADEFIVGKKATRDGVPFVKNDGIFVCDLTSTIIDDRGHMLGNYVSVQSIRQACGSLLEQMTKTVR